MANSTVLEKSMVIPSKKKEGKKERKVWWSGIYLPMLSNNISVISNHNCSIPDSLSMINIPLKDWTNNDHIILFSKSLKELC